MAPETSPYRKLAPADFLLAQIKVLEDLFGKEWFTTALPTHQRHPAYQRWAFCQNVLRNNGRISSPSQAVHLMRVVLDNLLVVDCSGGNPADITVKSFSGYGDEKVRKRLKSEIVHPRKFLDVLAELAYASSHIGRHAIFPSQETGMADFEVNLGGRYRPLVVDCKRLGAETRDARIATVIKKTNQQIKRRQQSCYGLAVIDVSSRVSQVVTPREKPSEYTVPPQVEPIRELCRNALSKVNTSVSGALLVWDECEMLGDPRTVDRSLFFFVRRSIAVPHAKPVLPLPEPSSIYELALTLGLWVTWDKQRAEH